MPNQIVAPTFPRTAYVLGAGFSRAASPRMPITDELGKRAASRVDLNDVPDFRADAITFENWLTWLAERQPFLSEAEHLHDRARFAELTEAIAAEVVASQSAAEESGYPHWMGELVDLLHWGQSEVVTLNYDTIVETSLDRSPRGAGEEVVGSSDAVTGFPNGRGVMFGSGSYFEDRATFHLHKLHGSVDWYGVPGDSTGATLERIPSSTTRGVSAALATIGGREVFIVPPTSTKGGYFDNPKTRFTWQRARDGLRQAERVVLIGYSLPLTDTALARLLVSTLANGTQEIVVVNPDADGVANRIVALGVESSRVRLHEGNSCVRDYVDSEFEIASAEHIDELTALAASQPSSPVAVGWEYSGWGAVADVRMDESTLHLIVDRVDQPLGAILHPASVSDISGVRPTKTLGDLFKLGRADNIVAEIDGKIWRICTRGRPGETEESDWVLLRPLGHQPDRLP